MKRILEMLNTALDWAMNVIFGGILIGGGIYVITDLLF